jgi:hypothetical protein
MKTIELIADVDAEHRLRAQGPRDLPEGPVRVLVLLPESTEAPAHAEADWMRMIAASWSEDLADSRQDLYTLQDGRAVDDSR